MLREKAYQMYRLVQQLRLFNQRISQSLKYKKIAFKATLCEYLEKQFFVNCRFLGEIENKQICYFYKTSVFMKDIYIRGFD